MFRIVLIHILIFFAINNSVFAFSKKKEKEIAEAKKLEHAGDSILNIKQYSNAIPNLLQAATIYEKNKLWIEAASNYRKTSWCYFSLDSIKKAQSFYDKALDIITHNIKSIENTEKFELSQLYYIQARIHLERREFDSTFSYLEKGLKIVEELNSKNSAYNLIKAKFLQTYGSTYSRMGDYDNSLKYNFQALRIRQDEKNVSFEDISSSNHNIAYCYYRKRDFEKAKEYLWYIIKNDTCKTSNSIVQSYNFLGILSLTLNQYKESIDYYKNVIINFKAEDTKDSLFVAGIYNNIGKSYIQLNEFENAIKYINKSIELRKHILGETHPKIARSHYAFGEYYYSAANYTEAIRSFSEAINILNLNQSTDKFLNFHTYNFIGRAKLNLGKNHEAISYIQKAICEVIEGFEYNDKLENPDLFFEGTNIIKDSIEIISKTSLYTFISEKAYAYHRIYEQTHNTEYLKKSLSTYLLAFKLLDVIRLNISKDESKFLLGKNERDYYKNAINISLKLDSIFPEMDYADNALELIDKSKSSSLKDNSYITNAIFNSDLPSELIEKERNLARRLAFYNTEINKNNLKADSELVKEYNTLAVEYDTVCNYIEINYPKYYNLTHQNEFSIDEIKSKINENELIIDYFISDNSINVITLDNKNYEIHHVKIDSTFKDDVLAYYRSIRKVEVSNYFKYNSVLYEKLIEPIKHRLNSKTGLIIIPDDYLYYVPFESLHASESNSYDFRKLNYLIKDFDIRYNYSLNFWFFNQKLNKSNNNYSKNFIGFAPVFSDIETLPTFNYNDTITRSLTIEGKRFSELPYSKHEISEISSLFDKLKHKSESYIHDFATEANFKNKIFGYKYVHISTHGFSDQNNPNLSGIAFYNSKTEENIDSSKTEDGLLYYREINNLNLNADLVVLSACETGLGKLVQGEGLIAITRGFITSGVPNIIYSLWNVYDKSTSVLMTNFYKEVLFGESYSRSLRETKLNMIENLNTSYPKIWSSFVLFGI